MNSNLNKCQVTAEALAAIWSFDTKDFDTKLAAYRREVPGLLAQHAVARDARHGRNPDDDPERYVGRRIDLMCRSVPAGGRQDPAEAVRAWLTRGNATAA